MLKKLRTLSLIGLVFFLISCSKPEATFIGVIEEVYEGSAIVYIEEGEILGSGDRAGVNLTVANEVIFEIGQRVKVGYTGPVGESYPLSIQTTSVELIE